MLACGLPVALVSEAPTAWERHSDVLVLPASAFASPHWAAAPPQFWQDIAQVRNCFLFVM